MPVGSVARMTPAEGSEIWIERRKYPDSPHYGVVGTVLGEDENGVWVGARPGSRLVLPDGTERAGERTIVWCVPRDDWFLLHVLADHPEVEQYIDISTPAIWNDRGARTIDLDLDIVVWTPARGGRIELVDEDEFAEHQVTLGYPDALIAQAKAAADEVLARVQAGAGPFSLAAAQPWFDRLAATTAPALER
jgi:hypothetical protein